MRAIMLLSGGLDSSLALRVILDQGIEVDALNFTSVFCNCTPKSHGCPAARTAIQGLDVTLRTENTSREFIEVVKHPKHGYGRNMNPCLDCRINMFRRAKELMGETRARFVVTGEVLGERPMSQRREAMALIEREAGLDGLVVRPLSAGLLEPSIPEKEGWVNRGKLLAISGRSRKPQMEMAEKYGMKDYPCPAGGCLLTDPEFAARMRDLIEHDPGCTLRDVVLLKVGRHFRLSPTAKAIIGRNEAENAAVLSHRDPTDAVIEVAGAPGPITLVRGTVGEAEIAVAARLTAAYGKARGLDMATVTVTVGQRTSPREVTPALLDAGEFAPLRVGK